LNIFEYMNVSQILCIYIYDKLTLYLSFLIWKFIDATIYVGGLDDKVTESLMWELFVQSGPVGKQRVLFICICICKFGNFFNIFKKIHLFDTYETKSNMVFI